MKTRLIVLFLAIFFVGLPATIHASEIQVKPALSVSASNGHIDIEAVEVSFKDVLREIESKAGVQVVIFDGVEDRKVSLSIKSLPALVVYVLPEGADISAILKGKHVIRQADFPNPDHAISIKGKVIETIRKSPDRPAIRNVKDEILLRFHRLVKAQQGTQIRA